MIERSAPMPERRVRTVSVGSRHNDRGHSADSDSITSNRCVLPRKEKSVSG